MIWCPRPPRFESCIHQRKTTCLISIRLLSKSDNKYLYHRSHVWTDSGSEVKWDECSLIIGTGCWVQVVCLVLDSSDGLWVGIQSASDLLPQTSKVRILHSIEEDNLSAFDSQSLTCARWIKQQICYQIHQKWCSQHFDWWWPGNLMAFWCINTDLSLSLRWRHYGCDSISNHQPRDCLLNR